MKKEDIYADTFGKSRFQWYRDRFLERMNIPACFSDSNFPSR
jgi:hypothetical protein